MTIRIEGVSHLLLDIEGTTCPVSFVAQTLFPYAAEHLAAHLQKWQHDPEILRLVAEVHAHWQKDPDPEAQALSPEAEADPAAIVPYLQWLIEHDRKLAPLKELQGRIWEEGYSRGALLGPLYPDVPERLQQWQAQGLILAVYSSGSIRAQQLLYGHSSAGDLRSCFQHWFDTRSGLKQDPQSYRQICRIMETNPSQVLFISDATAELDAASEAGLSVLFSLRPDNPQQDPGRYACISSFAALTIHAPGC